MNRELRKALNAELKVERTKAMVLFDLETPRFKKELSFPLMEAYITAKDEDSLLEFYDCYDEYGHRETADWFERKYPNFIDKKPEKKNNRRIAQERAKALREKAEKVAPIVKVENKKAEKVG